MATNGGASGGGSSTPSSQNEATVRAFYKCLNAKDAEGLYSLFDEDLDWDSTTLPTSAQKVGVPWLLPARGKQGLRDMSATGAAAELDTSQFEFQLKQVVVGGNNAFTVSETTIACKRTGKSVRTEGVHQFQFSGEGKIRMFRHFVDTGAHIWAWTPDDNMAAAWAAMGG